MRLTELMKKREAINLREQRELYGEGWKEEWEKDVINYLKNKSIFT